MAVKEARKIKDLAKEAVKARLEKLKNAIKEVEKDIENYHVKLQKGNSKTGANCYTVSLAPIIDCINCIGCRGLCYDLRNDCIYTNVIKDRARNSAIHKHDLQRFWREVENQIKELFVTELRINVGGDLIFEDFIAINAIAKHCPQTDILFFTKNYDDINDYLDIPGMNFESNVHPIMSAWPGMEMKNPHNLPVSHVLFADGTTTAPEYGAYYCGGNCSECHFNREGCWTLKKGEHVIFPAH